MTTNTSVTGSTNHRMKIFIGSSREYQDTAMWIASLIEGSGHRPLPWYEYEVFRAGTVTLDRLIAISSEADAAIFVFSEDDEVHSRGTIERQPRDNVVLEFGLFVGALTPKRSIICTVGNPKLPIDTAGHTVINVSERHVARPNLEDWLRSLKSAVIDDPADIRIGYLKRSEDGIGQLQFHDGKFTRRLTNRFNEASRIVMMGSGVAILGRPPVVDEIMNRAKSGECQVEIYLANPYSPAVETRLIEEEQGSIKPPDGKPGLLARLNTLLDAWRKVGSPKSVSINLCTQYPTFALVIVDDEYYMYPYGYRTLGNFSPVFVFSRRHPGHRKIVDFFDAHHKLNQGDALDAQQVLATQDVSREALWGFAVFFVPPADSQLYRFGTRVLGYDVRSGQGGAESKWRVQAGRASEFGFHLTICDALYFYNEAEVKKAIAEVSYILTDFGPFDLQDIRIEFEFPDANSVAISARDQSGQLESLHSEFVQRLYRRAAASDYTLGRNARSISSGKRDFIMQRYHVPYVLSEFTPHFTLLSNYRAAADGDPRGLRELFETEVTERVIRVGQLAIMAHDPAQERWSIRQSLKLGRA